MRVRCTIGLLAVLATVAAGQDDTFEWLRQTHATTSPATAASATRSGSPGSMGSGWRVSTRQNPHARVLTERIVALLEEALPLYVDVHKLYAVVGIGCTGGRHRSVVIANAVAEKLRELGMRCVVQHRDMDRLEAR